MFSDSSRQGSATLLTMLISAVIITVGISFNWLVKEHLRAALGLKAKSEAMLGARSAYEGLIFGMLSGTINWGNVLLHEGQWLPGASSIPLNGKDSRVGEDIIIRIRDSNGLLSLSTPNSAALERLIRIVAPEKRDTAAIIRDSFQDWTDKDRLLRLNGAEDAYYSFEGRPYRPRNYSIQYKEELGFIRGMDEDLYGKIAPFVTMLPNGGFNPNTASDEVLMAFMDIDRKTLEALKGHLGKRPLVSNNELYPITGKRIVVDEGTLFFPVRFMEISVSSGSPKPLYTISAGVDLRLKPNSPYSIIYWKED